MEALAERLASRTLELVNIPSPSRHEAELAAYVRAAIPLEPAFADGETLAYERRRGRPLVVLAGHLDTVPAQDNLPGSLLDGAVTGLGASDMKGGLAVMVELAREPLEFAYDLGLLFFPREELPIAESALPAAFAGWPALEEAELVVVLEPTDNTIQAGCLGHLAAELVFGGVSAHSARPWLGVNAIEAALEGLRPLAAHAPREVEIDGLRFVEVLAITRIEGGVATNVIPDRVAATVSFRYAPDRSPAEAEAELRRLAGSARVESLANSPPGRVAASSPLVQRLREAGGFELEAKQAWTPVAEFTERGLDAVNLGPGATRYAHTRDERVEVAELVRTFDALRRFLTG